MGWWAMKYLALWSLRLRSITSKISKTLRPCPHPPTYILNVHSLSTVAEQLVFLELLPVVDSASVGFW